MANASGNDEPFLVNVHLGFVSVTQLDRLKDCYGKNKGRIIMLLYKWRLACYRHPVILKLAWLGESNMPTVGVALATCTGRSPLASQYTPAGKCRQG